MLTLGTVIFLFETVAFIAFGMLFIRAMLQKHFVQAGEMVSALIFGWLLEMLDMHIWGTYHYASGFISIFGVPLAISCAWAIVAHSAMRLSDAYPLSSRVRPLLDALIAVNLDIAMDPVASKLGLWVWTSPAAAHGWYGVPIDNFFGWVAAVASFSYVARYIRTINFRTWRARLAYFASPFLSYVGLYIGIVIFWFVTATVQTSIFIFMSIIVLMVALMVWSLHSRKRRHVGKLDAFSFISLVGAHVFFILIATLTGVYTAVPILLVGSLTALFVQCGLYLYQANRRPLLKR